MIKMTTPTHSFTLPFGVSNVDDLRISYAQHGKTVLTKGKDDCALEGNTIKVTLTQEETDLFCTKFVCEIQVNVKTLEGKRLASKAFKVKIEKNFHEDVM